MTAVPVAPARLPEPVPQPDLLRATLRRQAVGVVVVSTFADDRPVGLTVASFTSVSLEPALVSFCIAESSPLIDTIEASDTFVVNLLASEQAALAARFGSGAGEPFAGVPWTSSPAGPRVDGALAWLSCTTSTQIPVGDHLLVIGAVTGLRPGRPGRPLVHSDGRFATTAPLGVPQPGPAGRPALRRV
ncbi:3-hydroxy-9,10-secoandrosta-1,3,5(10)-triene-9,17-dione monooxygenase reductase component [Motilibacter rhizosphaerae]|uniref:3-hydroxy-9,10-secoandrosta-1,3,5(10)-triene-9, 17-dione monooxygenase reductase component n=1 Tax=Motilibacter rhizosphaerae TaxID=598652 RepID=A0A4Q7NRN0_9ACTN|nr:flavin reductase family protein [Motilibacter rhizosphaerae]RZS87300.1 3-hydroxy-9,10-secoandrosta-1,3,5(10)-triene-9,17-dione monooxygenase reductase component [Motilibacter rhizosphaerae]